MRDAEKTIGNMIDKLRIAFLGSVDEERLPKCKSYVATSEAGRDKDDLSVDKYFIDACCTIPEKQSCLYVLL